MASDGKGKKKKDHKKTGKQRTNELTVDALPSSATHPTGGAQDQKRPIVTAVPSLAPKPVQSPDAAQNADRVIESHADDPGRQRVAASAGAPGVVSLPDPLLRRDPASSEENVPDGTYTFTNAEMTAQEREGPPPEPRIIGDGEAPEPKSGSNVLPFPSDAEAAAASPTPSTSTTPPSPPRPPFGPTGVIPPPSGSAGGTPPSGPTGGTPTDGHGLRPLWHSWWVGLVILVSIGFLGGVIVWMDRDSIPIPNRSHTNDLFHFSVRNQGVAKGWDWNDDGACSRLLFPVDQMDGTGESLPLFEICYLGPADDVQALAETARTRAVDLAIGRLNGAQSGVPQSTKVGNARQDGYECYLQGNDRQTNQPIQWRETIVQYDGLVYVVDAAATQAQWRAYEPSFQSMTDSLRFEKKVVGF
jgi:hypothetical protein